MSCFEAQMRLMTVTAEYFEMGSLSETGNDGLTRDELLSRMHN